MSVPSPPIVNDVPDARNGQIQFYWSPPLTGSPITNYTISSVSPSVSVSTGPTDNCTLTIFGLTNGTGYTFTITADNANGTSDPTTFTTVIPGAPPLPPQNQSYTFIDDNNVSISWSAPSSDGGAPIYRYGVWVFPLDSSSNPLSNLVSKVYTFGNQYNAIVQLPFSASLSNYKCNIFSINDADWSVDNPALYLALSSFNPTNITGLQLWLDGLDPLNTGTKPSNGATVSTWTDKSTSSFNATTRTGTITYNATTNGLVFNGSSAYNITGLTASSLTESVFVVLSFSNVTQTGTILGASNNGGRQFRIVYNSGSPTALSVQTIKQGISNTLVSNTTSQANTKIMVEFVCSSTLLTHYLNGSSVGSVSNPTSYDGSLTSVLGVSGSSSSEILTGTIHEVIRYNVSLSTTDRQKAEGYLAWNWGIQGSLPAGHPYKNSRPTI
jgi:hypothetical protein